MRNDKRLVNQDDLHRWMWEKASGAFNKFTMGQQFIAAEFDVVETEVWRAMREMRMDGRIFLVDKKTGTYVVTDPDEWVDPNPLMPPSQRRAHYDSVIRTYKENGEDPYPPCPPLRKKLLWG